MKKIPHETRLERATLAVNNAVSRASINRRKQLGAGLAQGLDQKRTRAWCEYGYPSQSDITFEMLHLAYRRSGLAYSGVTKTVSTCWLNYPTIKETEDDNDLTKWERNVENTLNSDVYREFKEADLRRLVGTWSALILHFNDNAERTEPVTNATRLNSVQAVWQNALSAVRYENGKVAMWSLQVENEDGTQGADVQIHPDRVFIIGDMSNDGMSMLEPCINNLINMEKIEGGGGESFLKSATRQLNVDFDKDIDLGGIAQTYGVEQSELVDIMNKAVEDLNAANDMLFITQGATVTPLVSNVPDPRSHYDINAYTVAAVFNMPVSILIGNITGERASTQDEKAWNKTCQSRRENQLSYDIGRFVDYLMEKGVIGLKYNYTVTWETLVTNTPLEKMAEAKEMGQVNQLTFGLYGSKPVFTMNEIRARAGLEAVEEEEYDPTDYVPDIATQ